MAAFALSLLLLAFTATPSSANWCVCKDGGDAILQKTLDYACGAGADCNPLRQGGQCFQPNTVRAHCSYAVNSYFQKKGQQQQQACDFAGTATFSASDPSSSGCVYPSSASGGGTGTTTPATGTTTPSIGSTTPSTGTPSTSTGTGTGTGLGTGTGIGSGTGTGTGTSTTGTTPYGSTPGTGVLGGMGMGTGLGPSGAGMNNDESHGGIRLSLFSSFLLALFSAFIMFLWG